MAKKSSGTSKSAPKKTRASQYENILTGKTVLIKDCEVLSFKFENEGKSHTYHFDIMSEGMNPLIYDGPGDVVRMVVLKDSPNIERYHKIAEALGGIYKECRAYNDYE